jgi:L-fucose mutarotase
MLLTTLLQPQILAALGRAGHGSRVLIADANFPHGMPVAGHAERVFLNLRPGVVTVPEVLATLVETMPIEAAALMLAKDGRPPPVHAEIQTLLPDGVAVQSVSKADFNALVRTPETALIIATGEERRFANVLLTIGVRLAECDDQPHASRS